MHRMMKKFNSMILDVLEEVKGGKSLADALLLFPDTFSGVYVNMVRAGEESGVLPKSLGAAWDIYGKSTKD